MLYYKYSVFPIWVNERGFNMDSTDNVILNKFFTQNVIKKLIAMRNDSTYITAIKRYIETNK